MKKVFLVLLSALLMLSLMSCDNEIADHGTSSEMVSETDASYNANPVTDFEYNENDDGITVTKYIGKSTELVIPETIDGKPVTEIGSRFASLKSVETVWIPDTVHTIRHEAFDLCDDLKSVRFPSGLINIESCAFRRCENLESIELPKSLTTIGVSAFEECKALKEITIPENVVDIGYKAFYYCLLEKLSFAENSRLETIGNSVFAGEKITELTLPSSVRVLESYAFISCDLLTKATLNDGLQKIGWQVFAFPGLRELVIPASVTEMNYVSIDCGFEALYFEGDLPENFFEEANPERVYDITLYLHEGAKGFDIEGADRFTIKTW